MPRVVKRRQASPLILQQLWEAIGVIREQKQIANLERISKYMNREYDYSPKETQRQLGYAVKDGLIIREISKGNKGSKIGVEQEGYWCIEQPEKPVTDDHDWYCTECHKAGDVIRCHGCFRVAHPKCLEKNKVPPPEHGHWYCFVCTACRKKNHMIGRSEVNKLLGFALMRMKEKARELYKKLNLKDTPYFYSLVHTHMDLSTMQQKVDDNKYRCLEDFEGDAALMLHNNIVYYGADSERVELCDMVVDDGKHDIQEIRICKDCYKMSNCRTTKDWFCRPCTNPHDLVWAQMKGFGYWPAKVIQRKEDQVDVRFFGGLHQRAWLAESNIKDIDTDIKQLKIKATPGWHSACKELKRHQVLLAARDKSGKTEKPERPEKTHKSHKAYKSRKRSREVEETEQDDAVSSSNGDQQVKVQADNVTSSQDSNQGSPAASTESTPAKRRKSSSNTSNLSSESPTPAKCDCHEKYTTIFTDFKARLEQEYQKEKEEAITEALEKLRAEMESDKQQTISRVKDTMMAEIDRTKKQTREKCQEEFEEELKKIEAKNKEEMSQTKKRQWCINCEEEAMYHCCWNTSYCSINCQQIHWHKEHKKLCRRKR
ncbi:zinc finger MYND domain-containing protein 11-like isoform X2 [Ptychodera flava]|uniref:zinc finger MYND domain-containing protein 11-like isoform X2 n=1 Tax=Ptychodera flava TaxID=63121 RepID=UPI00396AADE4